MVPDSSDDYDLTLIFERARACLRLMMRCNLSDHLLLTDAKAGKNGVENILDTNVAGDAAE
jgi:hypothetical protein